MMITTTTTPTDVTGQSTKEIANGHVAPETPKPEETKSPNLEALAKKERMLRQLQKQMQAREQTEAQLKSELEALKAKASYGDNLKSKLAQDPYSALIDIGLTPEQATNLLINKPEPMSLELQAANKRIADLESKLDEKFKQVDAGETQKYEQAKKQIYQDVDKLVQTDPSYEAIQASGDVAKQAVVELMEEWFNKTGVLLSLEDAAKEVEDQLIEDYFKFSQLNKIKQKSQPQTETPAAQQPKTEMQTKPQTQSTTLSNRLTPTGATKLSAKERRDRAIKAFLGQL